MPTIFEEIGHSAAMTEKDFRRLSDFIQSTLGIKLPPSKKVILQTRLQRRLHRLGIKSFEKYCEYIFSPEGRDRELVYMLNAVTTNKTEFFREAQHFDYLMHTALPELMKSRCGRIIIWSAGCSSGEEPYTIAMAIKAFGDNHPDFSFLILATDISTEMLAVAENGVYREERIEPVPIELRKKYLLKGIDRNEGLVKIAPEIRSLVRFRRLNFMEGDFGFREPIDIIFCRNVLIYFERDTQEAVVKKFCRHLARDGYLFIGHSESLYGMDVPLQQVAPAVYRRL